MRRFARAVLATAAAAISGCGGSASETPWPVEPTDIDPRPAGESPDRSGDLDLTAPPPPDLADAGSDAGDDE
jgi:hypothetical protein